MIFLQWLINKWVPRDDSLIESYRIVFTGIHGQRVLHDLLDNVYCQIYEGRDPIESAHLNGRRSVVHEILETLDRVEHPDKYRMLVESEGGGSNAAS